MAAISNAEIEVSKRKNNANFTTEWTVRYKENDETVDTVYRTFNLDDIIRKHWIKRKLDMYMSLIEALIFTYKGGVFFHRWRVRKPAIFICGCWLMWATLLAMLALTLSVVVCFLLVIAIWMKVLLVILIVGVFLFLGFQLEKKLELDWFFRALIFYAGQKDYNDEEYKDRRVALANQIIQSDQFGEYDEILIVGYSAGSLIVTEGLSRAMQQDSQLGKRKAKVNLLTIGGCIGSVAGNSIDRGYLPHFRHLATRESIDWLAISERYDISSEYYVNPFELLEEYKGMDPESIPSPRMRRARFSNLYSEEKFNRIKRNARIIHNQFISASDMDGEYNYFRLTCGPDFLSDQY